MAAEPTVRDALIAEMLGDIGKLHEAVDLLKTVLPAQADKIENRVLGLIDVLQKAGAIYQEQITAYTNAQGSKIREQMEKDALAAKTRFDRESSEAIRATLAEVENTVKKTLQTAIAGPVQNLLQAQRQNVWKTMAFCLACGLLGGALALSGNRMFAPQLTPEQKSIMQWGAAAQAAWPNLPHQAQKAIKDAAGGKGGE